MSTTDMVVAQPLLPIDPGRAAEVMDQYQRTTRAWLSADDWIGEPGAEGSFVKRSGWDKIATAYELSTEVISESIERDEKGEAIRAHAVVRAIAPSGRYRDGTGGCGINEPRFRSYGGTQKVEHDLPATAETRATNRAISKLVGFGAVSAEEVDADVRAGASATVELPPWAALAPDPIVMSAANQLVEIVQQAGADPAGVTRVGAAIRELCGGIPLAVVAAITAIHTAAVGGAPAPDAGANGGERNG